MQIHIPTPPQATSLFSLLLLWSAWMALPSATAQPELVHVQGRLAFGTNLVSGPVDLALNVYPRQSGGDPIYSEIHENVMVTDGLFSLFLGTHGNPGDLKAAIRQPELWLEYASVASARGVIVPFEPRERIGSSVYALQAAGVATGSIGTDQLADHAVTSAKVAANSLTAADLANNSVGQAELANDAVNSAKVAANSLTAADLANNSVGQAELANNAVGTAEVRDGSLGANDVEANTFWSTTGNAGTNPSQHFIGTTDNQMLSLRVNGAEGLAIRPMTDAALGGVSAPALIGGANNSAGAAGAMVGGGYNNSIGSGSRYATLSGGSSNRIGVNAEYATIPGGYLNLANASYSFAAGYRAKAMHQGSFVWADSNHEDFASTGANQFLIRASGGVGIGTTTPKTDLHVHGNMIAGKDFTPNAALATNLVNLLVGKETDGWANGISFLETSVFGMHLGFDGQGNGDFNKLAIYNSNFEPVVEFSMLGNVSATSFIATSDRHAKHDVEAIDPAAILEKVAALPITRWTFKTEPDGTRHLGPMAQDFHAAFGLGSTDTGIASVDADGVALAAIQALHTENTTLKAQLARQAGHIAEQTRRLNELERAVRHWLPPGE